MGKKLSLRLSDREITTERPAFIMGIVNCTPDSFYDKSRGGYDQAARLSDEGADIIDIGGESTRPGSEYITEEEEIRRIIPVIESFRKKYSVPVSVDTRKSRVMKAALDAGADIVNDISSFEDDPLMADLAAKSGAPVILMHKRGIPINMQKDTAYGDIFREVDAYLSSRADFAVSKGIDSDKIIIDPGIGFGKSLEGNISLIRNCGRLCGGKYPVLMALSRKTCIGELTGRDTAERLFGTLAANLLSVIRGATLVRVHDVAPCVDSMNVLKGIGLDSDDIPIETR